MDISSGSYVRRPGVLPAIFARQRQWRKATTYRKCALSHTQCCFQSWVSAQKPVPSPLQTGQGPRGRAGPHSRPVAEPAANPGVGRQHLQARQQDRVVTKSRILTAWPLRQKRARPCSGPLHSLTCTQPVPGPPCSDASRPRDRQAQADFRLRPQTCWFYRQV